MEKIDYKKVYHSLYKASSKKATIIDIPTLRYIAIKGEGAPTNKLYGDSIEALYSVAYTISMSYKNDALEIPNFNTFVCPPLEGHWSTIGGVEYDGVDQSVFKWEIRILMPEFVTEEVFEIARNIASKKKDHPRLKEVSLITIESKKHCVMMHLGPFANEQKTFDLMEAYTKEEGYTRLFKDHNEIYLSDYRKVSPDKLKTILTFEVK